MIEPLPLWIRLSFAALVAATAALLVQGVQGAVLREGRSLSIARGVALRTALVLAGWLLVGGVAALSGRLLDFTSIPPRLVLVVLPALIAAVAIPASGRLDSLLRAAPLAWPVMLQAFRIPVEFLLWSSYRHGQLARMMTFEGSNFDVLAGLTAPVVAAWCLRGPQPRRGIAVAWNIAGMALLLNVVALGLLSAPTPFQVFHTDPPNTLVGRFPFVWLPSFLVAVALFLHVASLRQLLTRASAPDGRK